MTAPAIDARSAVRRRKACHLRAHPVAWAHVGGVEMYLVELDVVQYLLWY